MIAEIDELEPLRIIFPHCGKIFLTYRWSYSRYWNKHLQEMWHNRDEWSICIGFKPSVHGWFKREESYYDGMTAVMLTICGVVFGRNYSYYCKPLFIK